MNTLAISVSLVAGFSTGVGALPIYLKREFSKASLDFGLGFSAGIMLVASFIALIMPSLESASDIYGPYSGILPVILGLAIGYKAIIYLHQTLPHEHLLQAASSQDNRHVRRVMMIIIAICLHNVPEGLSVGIGFGAGDMDNGLSLGLAISIQNMPEGLVVALGLLSIGMSKHRAFFLALLSGLVEPVAAVIGYYTTQITHYALPIAMAFAGGAMLFVICQEMFPELFREGHERNATHGLLLGVVTMLSLDFLIKI